MINSEISKKMLKLMELDNKLPKSKIMKITSNLFPTLTHHTKLESTSSSENTTNQLLTITSFSSRNKPFPETATKKSPLNALTLSSSMESMMTNTTILWLNALKVKPDVPPTSINSSLIKKRLLPRNTRLMFKTLVKPTKLSSRGF